MPLTSKIFKNDSKIKKGLAMQVNRSGHKTEKSERDKNVMSINYSASKINDNSMTKEEE